MTVGLTDCELDAGISRGRGGQFFGDVRLR